MNLCVSSVCLPTVFAHDFLTLCCQYADVRKVALSSVMVAFLYSTLATQHFIT